MIAPQRSLATQGGSSARVSRVALVEFFGIGGTADYTDCLARALAAEGIEVAVLTSSLFEPLTADPPYRIARVFSYSPDQPKPVKAWQLWRAIPAAREFLMGFRPDLVHAQGTVAPLIERRLYRSLAVPTVCTVHDARAHERRPWLGSFTSLYAEFDRLICHSEATGHALRRSLPGARIAVVPHGRYTPLVGALPDRETSRRHLGLPPDVRVVLFFGFIRRYKGLELLLDALQLARERGQAVRAVVAGRPLYDIRPSVERAQRESIPVDWHLRFIARQEFGSFFGAADVVALPYRETYDSGAFELAAAFRKPIVASDVGGLAEAFARYRYGRLLAERTAIALADALAADYPAPPRLEADNNTWSAVADRTVALYREALDG